MAIFFLKYSNILICLFGDWRPFTLLDMKEKNLVERNFNKRMF